MDDAGRAIGFGLVDQTKLMTAASELARNIVLYANGGTMTIEHARAAGRSGVRLIFEDGGPGIADLERAMQDGYSTGKGMGLGLPGAKRLAHEFAIASTPGVGTRVTFMLWKR
ncbi:anti-sigma regulatory factor [Azospirillum halopraeferens]|uniref:anti-sigma regulatory factor n=1 Tax=Azospirillum halopraeferens TaxID=34010 RepID=UPI0003F72405|nr:anti-sigma regulatory factor [Azospirillum halopraeferens]